MAADQSIATILDETIAALSNFDSARLESLEQRIETLSGSAVELNAADVNAILQKKHLLEILLRNCDANLNTLKRLHARSARESWVR